LKKQSDNNSYHKKRGTTKKATDLLLGLEQEGSVLMRTTSGLHGRKMWKQTNLEDGESISLSFILKKSDIQA